MIGAGILVTAVVAVALVTQAGPFNGDTLSCGLGLPPGSLGFAEARTRQAREAKQNGYLTVCDANLARFRIAFLSFPESMANLAFQPVALSGTPFAPLASLGWKAETISDVRSRLYRGFRTPEGHTVTLFEHDMSADGTTIHRAAADEPERVKGMPARLAVFQTPAGNAISHLSWRERRRFYELWIDTNVAGTPFRARLFAMAASLPASTPACPNERLPAPSPLDANGFPMREPPPYTMTEAEMDAYLEKKERPCR